VVVTVGDRVTTAMPAPLNLPILTPQTTAMISAPQSATALKRRGKLILEVIKPALRRYVSHRRERDMGTAMGRTEYHGLNPHLPLVLSRKGYPYALSLKSRSDAQERRTDYCG